MRPARYISFIVISSLFLLTSYLAPGMAAGIFSVKLDENKLSVTAENVALQTILRELAARGITVKIDPGINPIISADFQGRPLEPALDSLLKSTSYSLLWESVPGAAENRDLQLVGILVFRTGRKEQMQDLQPRRAEVVVKNDRGQLYVKDEILLYIPPGTDLAALRKFLRSFNATLLADNGLPGLVKVLLPENSNVFAIARDLQHKFDIAIAQPNYAYPVSPPVQYGTELGAAAAGPGYYAPGNDGAPIAILDSGLSDQQSLDKFVLASLDVMDPDARVTDALGHGTQMAFIASGVVKPFGSAAAPDAYIPIIPIRAFDDNGYTTDAKIADAVNFALANGARVMSLSWGSETRSAVMEKSLNYARDRGIFIVASAGNEPTGKPVYPAAYPSVIGVGALDPHGKTWENSNFGSFVALYAPGIANLPIGYKGDPGLYGGTSIAAAFVANTIAVYLAANPAATPEEVTNYLHTRF